jgi:hypothetical protein
MIKKSFVFIFAMTTIIAMFSLGTKTQAQTIPTSFTKSITGTTYTGNPMGYTGYFTGTGTSYYIGMALTSNAVTVEFPPILDANNSYAAVVYKQSEISLNQAGQINKLTIPVIMDPAQGKIYDAFEKIVIQAFGDGFAGNWAYLTPYIEILMKNGAEFNSRSVPQTIGISDYVVVWDGVYDPEEQIYPNWDYVSTTANLVIPFDTPFEYTGGDITVIFRNKSGLEGFNSAFHDGSSFTLTFAYTYKMDCFYNNDGGTTIAGDTAYLGPKFAFDGTLVESWDNTRDGNTSGGTTTPGTTGEYGVCTYPIVAAQAGWNSHCGGPTTTVNTSSVDFTCAVPGSAGIAGVDGYSFFTSTPFSVRPKITFEFDIQHYDTNSLISVADTLIPSIGVDTTYRLGRLDIEMSGSYYPLKLKTLKWSPVGSKSTLISQIKMNLYHSATDNIADAVYVGTMQPTDAGTQDFVLTTPITLNGSGGHNYFFITYDIPKPTAANGFNCGDIMSFTAVGAIVGSRTSNVAGDQTTDYTVSFGSPSQTKEISYGTASITNWDNGNREPNKEKRVCYDEISNVTLRLTGEDILGMLHGTYYGFRWDRWNVENSTWEIGVSDQQNYTFSKDTVYTTYRGKLLHPDSCSGMDSVIYNIIYERSYQTGDVLIKYMGDEKELEYVPGGTTLTFYVLDTVPRANARRQNTWQVNNGSGWMNIAGQTKDTASYTIPMGGVAGDYKIRLRIDAAKPECVCTTFVHSNEITFEVAESEVGFEFVNQPPLNKYLCLNDSLNLMVSYSGKINASKSCWQKDGQDLVSSSGQKYSSRFLNISLNLFSGGEYRYKAVDTIITLIGSEYVMDTAHISYSDVCRVEMIPGLEIYYVSQSQNYVMPGKSAGFVIYSSWVDNEDGVAYDDALGFQWYKHNASGADVKLEDNYYYKGSRSNALVITEAPEDPDDPIYTSNGDYYFLKITGPCGTIDSKDHPIFLMQGEGVEFIKNNTNAIICSENSTATFEVEVLTNDMSFVKYQWYVDGVEVKDGADYAGTTTPKLTITNATTATATYCKVTAFLHNYYINVNSDVALVELITMELVTKDPDYDVIKIADTMDIGIIIETNNPGSGFTFSVYRDDYLFWSETFFPGELGLTRQKTFTFEILKELHIWDEDSYTLKAIVTDDCDNIMEVEWTIDATEDDDAITGGTTAITNNPQLNGIVLTPNPTSNVIYVSYNSDVEVPTLIELCGLAGNNISILFDGISNVGSNKFDFDLSKLGITSGTYILKISNKNGFSTKQFVFVK